MDLEGVNDPAQRAEFGFDPLDRARVVRHFGHEVLVFDAAHVPQVAWIAAIGPAAVASTALLVYGVCVAVVISCTSVRQIPKLSYCQKCVESTVKTAGVSGGNLDVAILNEM